MIEERCRHTGSVPDKDKRQEMLYSGPVWHQARVVYGRGIDERRE